MASLFVAQAILDELQAVWTRTRVHEVDSFPDVAEAEDAFLVVHFPPSVTRRVTLGPDGFFEEAGVARLLLHAPIDVGVAYVRQALDELKAAFTERALPAGDPNPVRTEVPYETVAAEEPIGNWLQGAIAVPFYRRTQGV